MSTHQQTLEQYLRDADANGAIDHALRAKVRVDGTVTFYIHPAGRDGQTLDFFVKGDTLTCSSASGKPVPHI